MAWSGISYELRARRLCSNFCSAVYILHTPSQFGQLSPKIADDIRCRFWIAQTFPCHEIFWDDF
jgi:hypothetical protein